jgi:hypothetical protein
MSVYHDLGQFDRAYRNGYDLLASAGVPLRSPTYDQRRSGKPESRTPTGADPQLRTALVTSTQHLTQAVRLMVALREDFDGWEPTCQAETYVVTVNPRAELLRCDLDGRVVWKDPQDVTVPLLSPDEVVRGVRVCRGLFAALDGEWETLDDYDRAEVERAQDAARQAIFQLKAVAKVWSRPKLDAPPKVCARQGCWRDVGDRRGDVCQACVQKQYRERKKAS